MNTRLPANISELDRYDLTLLFSISFHSVPVPHPMTLLARLEEASKLWRQWRLRQPNHQAAPFQQAPKEKDLPLGYRNKIALITG